MKATLVRHVVFCPQCGQQLVPVGAELVHRGSGLISCERHQFGQAVFVEDREQEVLAASIALVLWYRAERHSVASLPDPVLMVLERADALMEAYDPNV